MTTEGFFPGVKRLDHGADHLPRLMLNLECKEINSSHPYRLTFVLITGTPFCLSGERISACWVLVWKSEGKRSLGRSRLRREDNIKMDLQQVGCGNMDWIDRAQDRDSWRALVNTVMNLLVPLMRGISGLADNRLASHEGLSSMG